MLPVVAGADETRRQILLYTLVLAPVGVSPWLLGYAGIFYGVTACLLGAGMLALAVRVYRERSGTAATSAPRRLFAFSILYLFLLFVAVLAERIAHSLLS